MEIYVRNGKRFVWDGRKAWTNKRKHGVDFYEASTVFDDVYARCVVDVKHSDYEERFQLVGFSLRGRMLLVCYCIRGYGGENAVRIISDRVTTGYEMQRYGRRR